MRTVKNLNNLRYLLLLAFTLTLTALAGCTLDGISDENSQDEVTEADLVAAGKILGESLSDENDGVMASLNDALATVSRNGFGKVQGIKSNNETPSLQSHDDDSNSGRGEERNFSYWYNPENGTHTIAFERIVHNEGFFKSVTDTLKYIFTDVNNEFIEHPRVEHERIHTIDFKGFREGIIETQRKESSFSRQDTFFIDGVSEASPTLLIDGVHYGEGNLQTQDDQGNDLQRSYTTQISFLDISIEKGTVQENQSLEQGVKGTLSWEIVITKIQNGSSEAKTITGTVEMNGDGTALLKFERFEKLFLINLDDGEVRDYEDEFEGKIKRVNIDRNAFTLASDRIIQITEETRIDEESDVTNLEQVARILEEGGIVETEGTGSSNGEVFVASTVKFEVEERDEEHFEGKVTRVKLDARAIVLNHELIVRFGDVSVISENSSLHSLETVAEAMEQGKIVYADGVGKPDPETNAHLLILEVKFIVEDPDFREFEGYVTNANLETSTFTLDEELSIRIGENTVISDSGDLHSLEAVAGALTEGQKIVAYGAARVDNETDAQLVAEEVKFLIQEPEKTAFEGNITATNLDTSTFTLNEEKIIRIGDNTIISENGDLFSLEAVAEAIQQGQNVIGFGEGIPDNETDAHLVATEVQFNLNE